MARGVPHKGGTSHWGTPRKDMGPVEVLWDGDGVPPGCEQTENITSRHTAYAVGNKYFVPNSVSYYQAVLIDDYLQMIL